MEEPRYGVYYREPKTKRLRRKGDFETKERAEEVSKIESHRTGQAHWPVNHQEEGAAESTKVRVTRVYRLRRKD